MLWLISANLYANYLNSSMKYSNSRTIALEDSYLHVNEIKRLSLIQRSAPYIKLFLFDCGKNIWSTYTVNDERLLTRVTDDPELRVVIKQHNTCYKSPFIISPLSSGRKSNLHSFSGPAGPVGLFFSKAFLERSESDYILWKKHIFLYLIFFHALFDSFNPHSWLKRGGANLI